jgi:hypothetical protein
MTGMVFALLAGDRPCFGEGEDDTAPEGYVSRPHRLFREARALMDQGEFEKAAALLEEALKELPGKGISFQLAVCYERMGRFASAWARFQEVAYLEEAAGDGARAQIARSRALAIASKVPHVIITVAQPADGLVVERDGVPLASATWGTPLPQDPVRVVISASAPGRQPWQRSIDLGAGESQRVDVPALEPVVVVAPAPNERAPAARSSTGASWATPRRIAALASGGLGLAGLATGAVFAIQSISTYQSANAYCNASNRCSDPRGVALRQTAIDDGNAATVAIGLGVVAVVAGVVLWISGAPEAGGARRSTEVTAVRLRAGAGGPSLVMEGAW